MTSTTFKNEGNEGNTGGGSAASGNSTTVQLQSWMSTAMFDAAPVEDSHDTNSSTFSLPSRSQSASLSRMSMAASLKVTGSRILSKEPSSRRLILPSPSKSYFRKTLSILSRSKSGGHSSSESLRVTSSFNSSSSQ